MGNEEVLTRPQREVLECVQAYISKHGIAPTIREIAEGLRKTSHPNVLRIVRLLEGRGYLARQPEQSRSIRLTEKSLPARGLPLVGVIAAGSPIQAVQQDERIDLGEAFDPERHFVLRVRGNSMIEDQIADGDLVIVERSQTCREGDLVVAIVNFEEATLKRLYREGGEIVLKPSNRRLKPIRVKDVRVQGIVVGVFRQLRKRGR